MTTAREIGTAVTEKLISLRLPKEVPYVYDQLILGGGPAWLTAAVYSARKRVDLLLLTEDIGGQMLWTSDIENYMGYHYISARELIEKFHSQVEQFPIDLVTNDRAISLSREVETILVQTKQGKRYAARTLIIATGKRSRRLNVPGESELAGRGVTYCAIADGPCFKGKDVAVIGGGNSGLTVAVDMIPIAGSIYCVNNSPSLRADTVLIERAKAGHVEFLLDYDVAEIRGKDKVESLVLQSRATGEFIEKPVNGVFIEVGLVPNTEFAAEFIELNPWKEIAIDVACKTSVECVFAAGDVTTVPEKQIIVAAGEGAKASLSAYHCLIRKSVPR